MKGETEEEREGLRETLLHSSIDLRTRANNNNDNNRAAKKQCHNYRERLLHTHTHTHTYNLTQAELMQSMRESSQRMFRLCFTIGKREQQQ